MENFFNHHYISPTNNILFKVRKRQECWLVPVLFNIILKYAIKKEKEMLKKEMKLSLL